MSVFSGKSTRRPIISVTHFAVTPQNNLIGRHFFHTLKTVLNRGSDAYSPQNTEPIQGTDTSLCFVSQAPIGQECDGNRQLVPGVSGGITGCAFFSRSVGTRNQSQQGSACGLGAYWAGIAQKPTEFARGGKVIALRGELPMRFFLKGTNQTLGQM